MPVPRIFEKLLMWSLLAVLICVVSSVIIRYVALPPSPQDQVSRQEAKYRSVNDAKFRSLLDAGSKALKEARYSEALDDFQEAERSTDQLTSDQYASLKSSRLQVASLSEASGNNAEAENAYKALAASANQQGRALSRAKHCDAAVGEFGDAEKFSDHLTETKQASLLESRTSLAGCLQELHRVPEAVEATQRMIDYLRASDELNPALIEQYMNLAREYSIQDDWNRAEQAVLSASESSDKIITRLAPDRGAEAEHRVGAAISQKAVALRWLIIAYKNEGKTDLALSTADDYFNFKLEAGGRWGIIRLSSGQKDIAALALQIASAANRPDAVDLWQQRLNGAR
jgi:tetratricopeptide (TPR) repeat protein